MLFSFLLSLRKEASLYNNVILFWAIQLFGYNKRLSSWSYIIRYLTLRTNGVSTPHGWCSCFAQLVLTKNTTWDEL